MPTKYFRLQYWQSSFRTVTLTHYVESSLFLVIIFKISIKRAKINDFFGFQRLFFKNNELTENGKSL
jgi:hypothetical protein